MERKDTICLFLCLSIISLVLSFVTYLINPFCIEVWFGFALATAIFFFIFTCVNPVHPDDIDRIFGKNRKN